MGLNKNNLPTYSIVIDEDEFESGIDFIAITETPAIEELSIRLSKHDKVVKLAADEEKRLVLGPAIIPDTPIYRNDDGHEYYVVFTRETIEKMVEKFNNEQRPIKFNVEHNEDLKIEGFIKESWIIEDPDMDKSKLYGFDLPVGTWMISAKFSEEVWNDVIKQFKNIGYSIEGLMGVQPFNLNKDQKNMTKKVKKNQSGKAQRKNKFFVNKISIKRRFNVSTKKFEDVLIDNEEEVLIIEGLEEGAAVETIDDEGEMVEAEDGTYEIPSEGIIIEVEDGEIEEIQESEVEEEDMEMAEDEEEEEEEEEEDKEQEMADKGEVLAKIVELETRLEAVEALLAEVHDEGEEGVEEFSTKRRSKRKKTRFSKDTQKAERLAMLARLLK